jgi:hypothetical protein
MDEHSSLLQKHANYGQKRFITFAPGALATKSLTKVI